MPPRKRVPRDIGRTTRQASSGPSKGGPVPPPRTLADLGPMGPAGPLPPGWPYADPSTVTGPWWDPHGPPAPPRAKGVDDDSALRAAVEGGADVVTLPNGVEVDILGQGAVSDRQVSGERWWRKRYEGDIVDLWAYLANGADGAIAADSLVVALMRRDDGWLDLWMLERRPTGPERAPRRRRAR